MATTSSSAKYTLVSPADENEALLASDDERSDDEAEGERHVADPTFPPAVDPRFIQPTPSWWKRLLLLLFIVFLFWLAFQLQASHYQRKSKVIHASRYSKDFKFRPAASPIITETLKDGRVRLRGAAPTSSDVPPAATATATPKTTKAKKTGRGKKKRSSKRNAKKGVTR